MNSVIKVISSGILCVCSAAAVAAADLDDLKKKAESGDAAAQYEYAEALAWGAPGGLKQALPWYAKSAAQGNPYAQVAMANDKLTTVKPGSTEEKAVFEKICPSLKEAIKKMESGNSPEDAYNLADVYNNGLCVEVDKAKSLALTRYAAEQGDNKSQIILARHFRDQGEPTQMLRWYDEASKNGLSRAKLELIECYLTGKGTEKDIEKGKRMLNEQVEAGDPVAWAMLGFYYLKGRHGYAQDIDRGLELLAKAAKAGVPAAADVLAREDKISAKSK